MINVEPQDMDLFSFVDTGDLNSRDDLHVEIFCGLKCLVDSCDGVVVCEGHCGETEIVGAVYDLRGS